MWETEQRGSVTVATYTHPPMNYLVGDAVSQLEQLIDEWVDPAVKAVVLTGSDGRFIPHFSVEEVLAPMDAPLPARVAIGPDKLVAQHRLFDRLTHLPKPVVAGLTGDTMGAGLILALACDVRVAQRGGDHRFGLPEVRLGLVPAGSGVQRLVRLIGFSAAIDLVLRARVLTPEEALAAGIVHELAADPRESAIAIAQQMADLPAVAFAMTKHAAYRGSDLPIDVGVALEAEAGFRAKLSPQATEAMQEFLAIPEYERRAWFDASRPDH
jgi:enoyl-CoA hydratase/carnithine racemase